MASKTNTTTIYHLSYRIGSDAKQHIYALDHVCEKKKKELQQEYGENIKFSKKTIA